MSPTDYGWLVLLFPLLGTVLIMLGWPRWPGRSAGWIASAAIGLAFASSIGMLLTISDQPEEGKSLIGTAYEYIGTSGFNADGHQYSQSVWGTQIQADAPSTLALSS